MLKINRLIWLLLSLAVFTVVAGCAESKVQTTQPSAPRPFGPSSFTISANSGDWTISSVKPDDRVEFSFSVAGSPVQYTVKDPNGKAILTSGGGNVSSGQVSFLAASAGTYLISFVTGGAGAESELTIQGTVYPAQ